MKNIYLIANNKAANLANLREHIDDSGFQSDDWVVRFNDCALQSLFNYTTNFLFLRSNSTSFWGLNKHGRIASSRIARNATKIHPLFIGHPEPYHNSRLNLLRQQNSALSNRISCFYADTLSNELKGRYGCEKNFSSGFIICWHFLTTYPESCVHLLGYTFKDRRAAQYHDFAKEAKIVDELASRHGRLKVVN